MKLISENGNLTFTMRAGKDLVKSQMPLKEGIKLINNSTNVVETDNEVIVDDKYFFPAEKEDKPAKKNKRMEKKKNE